MEQIQLSFVGPFGWFASSSVEALSQAGVARSPGIYLWTSPTPNGEFVYYVGETARSFVRRMDEHLSEQLSGRYRIYEPEAFAQGRKQLLWRGVYGPGAEPSVEGFVSQLSPLRAISTDRRVWSVSSRIPMSTMRPGLRTRRLCVCSSRGRHGPLACLTCSRHDGRPNKGMKLTKLERNEASQLIPSVRQNYPATWPTRSSRTLRCASARA